ncbi:MAG: hypothetical protein IKE43_04740 [Coriobacteriales bacterium]|nr:hypothetical protein [Coriobacteriales bacterium]
MKYYKALEHSGSLGGDSTMFIEFMLNMIKKIIITVMQTYSLTPRSHF